MNPYNDTIFNQGWADGNNVAKAKPFTMKYRATVYQGDTTFATPFRDSVTFQSGANLPTGSIAYFDATDKVAKPGVGTASAANCPVPCIVYMGNDQKSIQSQKGNIAGGIVTLIPCTGYFRVVTTIFDSEQAYNAGDFLTATVQSYDGLANVGVITNDAKVYEDVILGIADGPVTNDHFDLPSLRVTCYFIPPVVASSN